MYTNWEDIRPLFTDDVIVYVENIKELTNKQTKNLLEPIGNYSKIAGYKINIQNSTDSLYAKNGQVEFEIKKTVQFTLVFKKMKSLGYRTNKICKRSI